MSTAIESVRCDDALLKALTAEFQPATPSEHLLVEEMAAARAALLEVRAAEAKARAGIDLCDALDNPDLQRKITRLKRFESQYLRQFERAEKLLLQARLAAARVQKLAAETRDRHALAKERKVRAKLAVAKARALEAKARAGHAVVQKMARLSNLPATLAARTAIARPAPSPTPAAARDSVSAT